MPEGLQKYIQTNTYLSWDDPWFWKKLRYALPHKGATIKCCPSIFSKREDCYQMQQPKLNSDKSIRESRNTLITMT